MANTTIPRLHRAFRALVLFIPTLIVIGGLSVLSAAADKAPGAAAPLAVVGMM